MPVKNLGELNEALGKIVEETGLYSDERGESLHRDLLLLVKSVLRRSDITLDPNVKEAGLATPLDESKKFEISGAVDEYLMYEGSLESFSDGFNTINKKIFGTIIILKMQGDLKALKKGIRDIKAFGKREKTIIRPRLNKLMNAILNGEDFDAYIKSMIKSGKLEAKPIALSNTCQGVIDAFKEILGDTAISKQ